MKRKRFSEEQIIGVYQSGAVSSGGNDGLWKRRSLCDLGKFSEFSPFPQPRRRREFGKILTFKLDLNSGEGQHVKRVDEVGRGPGRG